MVARRDVLEQVPGVEIGVRRSHLVGLVLGEVLDSLVGLEMVLDPVLDTFGIDPQVGVRAVPVHVAPGFRDSAVAHQPGDLVGRLGVVGPEVPLHVVVAQAVAAAALYLGRLDLEHMPDAERLDLVFNQLLGTELQRLLHLADTHGAKVRIHDHRLNEVLGHDVRLAACQTAPDALESRRPKQRQRPSRRLDCQFHPGPRSGGSPRSRPNPRHRSSRRLASACHTLGQAAHLPPRP